LAVQQNRIAMRELLLLGLAVSTLLITLTLIQVAGGFIDPVVGAYGLRNYLLYMLLPMVMYSNMTSDDIERLLLLLLKISVPLGALGTLQAFLPVDHILNVGVGEGDIFTAGDQVRTYGTFSFTAGHSHYITFMTPLAAGTLVYFSAGSKIYRWAAISLFAMSCAAVTSGSRGVIVGLAVTVLLYIGCALLLGGGRKTGQFIVTALLLLITFLVSLQLFEDRFDNIIERFRSADEAEGSIIARAFSPLTRLGDAISDGSFLGVGIGKGTGGGSYLGTGTQSFTLDEIETLRIIQECGAIVGILYIILRVVFLVTCIRISLLSLKYSVNPIPLLLASFIIPSLLTGQITLNNTSNGFNWLGIGLLFCLSQLHHQQQQR
jgi:hypothetical protein